MKTTLFFCDKNAYLLKYFHQMSNLDCSFDGLKDMINITMIVWRLDHDCSNR